MQDLFIYKFGFGIVSCDNPESPVVKYLSQTRNHVNFSDIGYCEGGSKYGHSECFTLEIWDHSSRDAWIFDISTCMKFCFIIVEGWPDFLDAIRYFAPMINMSKNTVE